ncbi:MAG: hypothetical protein ACLPVY_24735 [Acidimicrobiia bacterium]
MFRKRMAVATLALACLSTPLVAVGATAPSAGAATGAVTISGKLAGVTVSSRVLVLSLGGRAWASAPLSGGAFRISIPSADRNALTNATVQVISAKGAYMGPVVLAKGPEIANPACKTHKSTCPTDDYLGFSAIKKAAKVSIGTLRAKNVTKGTPAWFLASKVSSKYIGTYIVRARNKTGEPYGAGTDGFLKRGIPDAHVAAKNGPIKAHFDDLATSVSAQWISFSGEGGLSAQDSSSTGADPNSGSYSEACPSTTDPAVDATSSSTSSTSAAQSAQGPGQSEPGSEPGQGLDCSGVPNALNLDVNGNGTLNTVDPSAASSAATSITTWAQLQSPANEAINWHANNSLTTSGIDTWLEGLPTQSFGVTAVVPQSSLFPSDPSGTDVTATVDCGTLVWCSGAQVGWAGANGGLWSTSTPPYLLKPYPGGCPVGVSGPSCSATLGAGISPVSGTDIIGSVTPGQILTVNATQTSGSSASTELQVAPYFVTTPYVANATYAPQTGSPTPVMTADSLGTNPGITGTLNLSIYRPERLALPSETSTTGIMDQTGLHYSVEISQAINGSSPGGSGGICPSSSISNVTSGTATSSSLGGEVTDSATSDFDPAGSGNPAPVGFSVNLAACTAALGSGYSFSSGNSYYVSVIADGEASSTGGAPTAWVGFDLVVP